MRGWTLVTQLIIAYFVAVGMPIELHGDYQNCPFLKWCHTFIDIFRLARRCGFQWCLNFNHSTKYTEVINVSWSVSSMWIDYNEWETKTITGRYPRSLALSQYYFWCNMYLVMWLTAIRTIDSNYKTVQFSSSFN